MRHPFEKIPQERRARILMPLLLVTLLILAAWVIFVSPIATNEAPLSIPSFGTAGSVRRAREMIASWDERARLSGTFGIGLDFLQLVVYSTTFALACAWAA
jgi:hypothetical protein